MSDSPATDQKDSAGWCQCGSPIPAGARDCPRCGPEAASGPAASQVPGQAPARRPSPREEFSWEANVPLLTNRFMVGDMFFITAVAGSVTLALVLVVSLLSDHRLDWQAFVGMAKLVGVVTLGLLVVMALVMLLFFFNRFPMRFSLSSREVGVVSLSRRGKWANRAAVMLGFLARSPGTAGAGLLGMSQEVMIFPWKEVQRIRVHPEARVITVIGSWHRVFRLYCTPENFEAVRKAVETWFARGQKQREQARRQEGPSPAPRHLVLSLLSLAAGVCLAALPLEVPGLLRWALPGTALLGIWLPALRRWFGAAILAAVAAVVLMFLVQGLEERQLFQEADYRAFLESRGVKVDKVPDWALFKYRRFERLEKGEWAAAGVAGLGSAFFLWLGIAAVRDRLDGNAPGT